MTVILGVIADDLTGATDIALTLRRGGMKVLQVTGVPDAGRELPPADAVVVALKSRTIPAADAIKQSLAACDWLLGLGARQIFFKYCSTFDSTDDGNIGPVADALMARLGCNQAIACPAFPANGRSVYQGHLFVGDRLLSESPLKDHPLTPMHDPDLVRVLQRQSRSAVGLIPHAVVDQGAAAIEAELAKEIPGERQLLIVDAISETHLMDIGLALGGEKLITGGSGVALGLPALYRQLGWLAESGDEAAFAVPGGDVAILAGSCSEATRRQVALARQKYRSYRLDPQALMAGRPLVEDILAQAAVALAEGQPVLIYSSDDPAAVKAVQERMGRDAAGQMVEEAMAGFARGLRALGVRRFVVAGGETSGAVVQALGVDALEIGPEIAPGVPWTVSLEDDPVALALKSGNFGQPDFFRRAVEQLPAPGAD